MAKRLGYKAGVEFIALNDEPTYMSDEEQEWMAGFASVHLLALLFNKEPATVAADVVKYRRNYHKRPVS